MQLRMNNLSKIVFLQVNYWHRLPGSPRLRSFTRLKQTEAKNIDFVNQTGRILHPGKRGMIGAHEPPALRKLGLGMNHWTMQVKGIGSGYWRAVGTAEELIEKAAEIGQNWLCGVGFARFFHG